MEVKLEVPTVEQVCKALSEYYGTEIFYEKSEFRDGFHNGSVYAILYEDRKIKLTTTYFNAKLPQKLFVDLGLFYQYGGKE